MRKIRLLPGTGRVHDRKADIARAGFQLSCVLLSKVFAKDVRTVENTILYAVKHAILAAPQNRLSRKWQHRANDISYNADFVDMGFVGLFDEHRGIIQAFDRPEARIEYAMRLVELWLME